MPINDYVQINKVKRIDLRPNFILVGDNSDENKCVPFISQYSDCSEANMCSGCTRCSCTEEGKWSCRDVFDCPEENDGASENTISEAIDVLFSEVKERERKKKKKEQRFAPLPSNSEFDVLIVPEAVPYEEDFEKYMARNERKRRSAPPIVANNLENNTVKFHNIVDEINEDTLKNSNKSGTIKAQKVNGKSEESRRYNINNFNKSELSSLHIEYNQPHDYEQHITENRIDSSPRGDDKSILYNNDNGNIHKIFGNYSQITKDKDLSKIVVNELKKGTEIIGDINATPVSNITFTPENDTLTAMAFIAGNLLNKLWKMDKDSSDSMETDSLKHEKINDLLELFKEPLNLRQEIFLKNTLEKLSNSLSANKNVHNISICETISSIDTEGNNINTTDQNKKCNNTINKSFNDKETSNISSHVAQKLTDVLNLIKQFENTQKELSNLREKVDYLNLNESSESNISKNKSKFNLFGNVLEKITKLLLPSEHSKRLLKRIKNLNQLNNNNNVQRWLKGVYGTKLTTLPDSDKDKIILDYINHIQNNPKCLLSKIIQEPTINFKGDILNSLTDFLKVKSVVDITKLVEPPKFITTSTSTSVPTTTTTINNYKDTRKFKEQGLSKLATAKERLKLHLQSIIKDLSELQSEGGNIGHKINITDLLPCLGNIINENNKELLENAPETNMKRDSPINNIKKLIDALQLEFKFNRMTRKSGLEERPTSAKVWQRIITTINDAQKQKTRRFDANKSKSYKDLKVMIENIEPLSNSYKNYALLSVIPPHKKLMLLKTLEADVSRHKNILNTIKNSYSSIENEAPENIKDLIEFIDNTATNIKLSNNVLISLKSKNRQTKSHANLKDIEIKPETKNNLESFIFRNKSKQPPKDVSKKFKLTREQIMNQLMSNRIQLYLKIKEEEGVNEDDLNYNIGKRALIALLSGNNSLAKELYNILVDNKIFGNVNHTRRTMSRKGIQKQNPKGTLLYALKKPLLKIEDTVKDLQANTQDLIFAK